MDKTKRKSLAKSVWIFFIVIILLIILGLFILSLVFKTPEATPSAFGYSLFLMDDDGMGDAVPKNSLVITKNYSPSADNIGDAILCENIGGYGSTVLRLAAITPTTETVFYEAFFDNDPTNIITVPAKDLVGQAVSYHVVLGKIITFVTSTTGVVFMIVIPALLLALCELLIALFTNKDNKNKKSKDKFKRQMDAFDIPDESPFSERSKSSRKPSLSIDNIILGTDLKGRTEEDTIEHDFFEDTITPLDFNKKSLRNVYNNDEDLTSNRVPLKTVSTSHKEHEETSSKVEKVIVRPSVSKKEGKEPSSPYSEQSGEAPAIQSTKPAEEASAEFKSVQQTQSQDLEKSNRSLSHLIKLMEEQEKLLKDKYGED
ncbi:MAG: hypothetical protein GX896_04260 [Clostridiales bacterium]|nr:hypothetical protein [Clostridiales bacterium]